MYEHNIILCLRKTRDEYMFVLHMGKELYLRRLPSGLSCCSADATAETPLMRHDPAYSDTASTLGGSIELIFFSSTLTLKLLLNPK